MEKKINLKPVDDVFKKFLTPNEICAADAEADEELKVLRALQEDISKFVVSVMKKRDLGFRAFAREHDLSLSMAAKILKGSGNLTFETIANIAAKNGNKVHLVFEEL